MYCFYIEMLNRFVIEFSLDVHMFHLRTEAFLDFIFQQLIILIEHRKHYLMIYFAIELHLIFHLSTLIVQIFERKYLDYSLDFQLIDISSAIVSCFFTV